MRAVATITVATCLFKQAGRRQNPGKTGESKPISILIINFYCYSFSNSASSPRENGILGEQLPADCNGVTECTLAPSNEYKQTIRAWRRCSIMSHDFDHL